MLFNISTVFFDISLFMGRQEARLCIFNINSIFIWDEISFRIEEFAHFGNDGKENIYIKLVYNFEKHFSMFCR